MIIEKLVDLKKKFNLKKLDLHTPFFSKNDYLYLKKCIDSKFVSTQAGYFIKKFRSKILNITKSKYLVLVNSGSSAIYLGLRSINIKKNEEVLMPTLNYIANANAVKSLNATPHFIDSESTSLGIDIDKLEIYLRKNFKIYKNQTVNIKTKKIVSCLIATHIFGVSCDMNKLSKLCRKYKIKLLEDASEALGSKYNGKHLGTYGDVGVLSFNGNKIITSGAGGALMTNSLKIYKKADHLSQNAKVFHKWKYEYTDLGYNIKMPNLNAALGLAQIEKLKKYIKSKRKLFELYNKAFLKKNEMFTLFYPPKKLSWNYWLITILLKPENIKLRDQIILKLNNKRINVRPIWQLNHKINIYKNCPKMNLSNSEKLEKKIINLPSSAHLLLNEEG
jgi:perosamine synthetase